MDGATTASVTSSTRCPAGSAGSACSQPDGRSAASATPDSISMRATMSRATPREAGSPWKPHSISKAQASSRAGSPNWAKSRIRTPSLWPASTITCRGAFRRRASAMLRGSTPVSSSGSPGSCMECRSSSQSARSTQGRRAAARLRSAVIASPRRSALQTRFMSSCTKREASWLAGSKRSKASRLQKASVRLPRRGRRPAASRSFSAQAPHSSLPCTSADTMSARPGAPESKCHTPGVPVLPARSAPRSGTGSLNSMKRRPLMCCALRLAALTGLRSWRP
ncbi:hypothetical protein D9M72_208800 [compost metagenome]